MASEGRDTRKWVYFFSMLIFWFATLSIFIHFTPPNDVPGACVGATVVSIIAGFCFYLTFVED